jgi:hypothetical protein
VFVVAVIVPEIRLPKGVLDADVGLVGLLPAQVGFGIAPADTARVGAEW